MEIFDLQSKMELLYDVADVRRGYKYWFSKLLDVLIKMFKYDNLPEGLPAREIELNLLITGHAVILANPDKPGQLFTPLTSIAGVDQYYQPEWAVFANPDVTKKNGKQWMFDKDCINIWNNSLQESMWYLPLDGSMYTFIARYARQLADIESSINIYMVNSRASSLPVSDDNTVIESIKLFFKKLAMGKRSIITDSNIVEKFRNVDFNNSSGKDDLNGLLVARDKILEQFYRDIGIRMYNPKRAQVTESELESNDQLLLINHDDMLECRETGIDKVNDMFGTNISISLNPLFDIKEVMSNEQTQTDRLPEAE